MDGALLQSADGGARRTGVVALPQIGAAGLCGWLPYATHLAERGAVVLSVDPCDYGTSECVGSPGIAAQVDAAAEHLRSQAGVSTVVLVGASMGGSQAVRAVAQGATVDRWANISGPSAWEGERLLSLSSKVGVPGLVVHARRDGDPAEFRRAATLARRTDAGFVAAGGGHGWDLLLDTDGKLTRIGTRVADFVCTPGCA